MDYLTIIRNLRKMLFTAFLITTALVTISWIFIWADFMHYFMWAMPDFSLAAANIYTMWLIGIMHITSIVLFLVPTVALSLEIWCKSQSAQKKKK